MNVLIYAVVALTSIGVISAVILFFAAKKFKIVEDERIGKIEEALPGANCGGCGFAGCHNLAEAFVKSNSMEGLRCSVGGDAVMEEVADILGLKAEKCDPMVAVVRCAGSNSKAVAKSHYDGISSCSFANSVFAGESGCRYGCLGMGDCVKACQFGAISIDEETGLPVVDEEKCTGCGACTRTCPRGVIELRKKGPQGRRVFVSCINAEKGVVAKKNCDAACIGCGKCVKSCQFEAITLENNHAYIDFNKCKLCRKCFEACPTGAIHAVNFPPAKLESIGGKLDTTTQLSLNEELKKVNKTSKVVNTANQSDNIN